MLHILHYLKKKWDNIYIPKSIKYDINYYKITHPINKSKGNLIILKNIISNYFEMNYTDIIDNRESRKQDHIIVRRMLFAFGTLLFKMSYTKLSIELGLGKDHATVMFSNRKLVMLYETNDKENKKTFDEIKEILVEKGFVIPENWAKKLKKR